MFSFGIGVLCGCGCGWCWFGMVAGVAWGLVDGFVVGVCGWCLVRLGVCTYSLHRLVHFTLWGCYCCFGCSLGLGGFPLWVLVFGCAVGGMVWMLLSLVLLVYCVCGVVFGLSVRWVVVLLICCLLRAGLDTLT